MKTAFFEVSVARDRFEKELYRTWEVIRYGDGTEIVSAADALEVIVKKFADAGYKYVNLVQVSLG